MPEPLLGRVPSDVAEIQGLYGAFSFPEKLLQKIWLRRDFDHASARLCDGRRVTIAHPGKWNLLGGPDFRDARLRLENGMELCGDVELHLRAQDWDVHGHARDRAYDGVVLHVVLFAPDPRHVTRGAHGQEIPVLVLLPLLYHGLEEYAADEAVETLANRPTARLTNELAAFTPVQLALLLQTHARARWRQRVHFAQVRLERLGWDEACHHAALEVLGFRYNRSPMLRIAGRWPLRYWAEGQVDAGVAFDSQADTWSLQGVRPANHPRSRLRQYVVWCCDRPDWPRALVELGRLLPRVEIAELSHGVRHHHQFLARRIDVARQICAGTLSGSRLENLICDAFLPLLAARDERNDLAGCWFHWFCGDMPPFIKAGLRQLAVCDGRQQPLCHGYAQGLLNWLIEREVRR